MTLSDACDAECKWDKLGLWKVFTRGQGRQLDGAATLDTDPPCAKYPLCQLGIRMF